jgi:sugar-specific transcriptional regulator TrmB/DNA-binding CsgD family transcriptional regulator
VPKVTLADAVEEMAERNLLAALGIFGDEERLYRYFLRHHSTGVESAVAALDIDRDAVDEAFEKLAKLGLVRLADGLVVVAVDPSVAVEKLIESSVEKLNTELRSVISARAVIPSLLEDQLKGRQNHAQSDMERIEGLPQIRARLDDLAFFVHSEVLALQQDGPLSPGYIEAARPLDLRCLRRGIRVRTVVLQTALEDSLTSSYIRELVTLGAQVRAVRQPMERMIIYDRSIAVVPMDPADSARGALLIRQPSLVANMVALFDRVWSDAQDVDFADAPEADGSESITTLEKEILDVLARVSKDEIAARELGMSLRTFRRHVADLMLRLGASNRFQAALMAKHRGWI